MVPNRTTHHIYLWFNTRTLIIVHAAVFRCECGKSFKGNPNYQGILSWIIQIFHYYCRKQYKNIENSRIIEQNLFLSLPFSQFTTACASCHLPSTAKFLNVTSDHSCCIYFCSVVENGFLQVKADRCHCLHKKTVFTITSIYVISCLQLLQNVYTNLSLL